jgi:hypothetical protein
MNLHSAIRSSIQEQDRQEALVAFHRGWDDGITEDTILQGLMARYTACGKQGVIDEGLRMNRPNLSTVEVFARESLLKASGERRLARVKRVSSSGVSSTSYLTMGYKVFGDYAIWVSHPDLWNEKELEEVSEWLMENYHHH